MTPGIILLNDLNIPQKWGAIRKSNVLHFVEVFISRYKILIIKSI